MPSIAATHDWLSLVQLSGLLVSEPVLATTFPDGPERVSNYVYRRFSREHERFRAHSDLPRWTDFVLETMLELPRERWCKSHELPDALQVSLLEYNQELRPSRALLDEDGQPALLVSAVPERQALDKPETQTGRWKASPHTKLDRLLRESGVPFGLLTNGIASRLLYAPASLTTASITWSAATWVDEKLTLDAFYTLLNARRFDEEIEDNLPQLVQRSQERQLDVADQLGEQVRAAVGIFIRAMDEADHAAGGEVLKGMPLDRVYEMALSLMMRLVFMLYAEENSLLPHGEVLYDRSYGLTYLVQRLEQERRSGSVAPAHLYDAWPQLLAAFRLIYNGSLHPDLNLRDYRGDLFNPQRFQNPQGQPVLEHPALRLNNETVYRLLRELTFARGRLGRERILQRISYRTLDIEQIGYVYEGLLDHKVARAADEVLLKLVGKPEAVVPLPQLEALSAEERAPFLAGMTDKKEGTLVRWLEEGGTEDENELYELYPPQIAQRTMPFARVVAADGVILPHRLYITVGDSRRATGTHYTPQSLTEPIVRTTLEPLLYKSVGAKPEGATFGSGPLISAREILNLKVCDMAMGSGAFLVQACRYLSERLVEAWELAEARFSEAEQPPGNGSPLTDHGIRITPFGEPSQGRPDEQLLPPEREERLLLARRLVAERCLYGVDKNPLAVEMARLSLWLATLAKDKPFTFLDHALKPGDSLVGVGSVQQFTGWSLDGGERLPILEQLVGRDVQKAIEARRRLQAFTVYEAQDLARKEALLAEAEQALERVRLGCDLLVGTYLSDDSSSEQLRRRSQLLTLYTSGEEIDVQGEHAELAGVAIAAAEPVRPFHWPFEFPEVFLDERRSGFDAFVGNPPFLGGKRLVTVLGEEYVTYLRTGYPTLHNTTDLAALFFLRAFEHLRDQGTFGLIATNTISQGDTREAGLGHINQNGGTIYAARPNMPWPGVAAVHVSTVHVKKGAYTGEKRLEDVRVPVITPYLDSTTIGTPKTLIQNAGKSFIGVFVRGIGFVLEEEETKALIAKDPRNADVIRPYLTGSDLNSNPYQLPSRWVIDFSDWPLEKAEEYPDCLQILRERVYEYRQGVKQKSHQEKWWQFANTRPGMRAAIAPMERVLVIAEVSKTFGFAFMPTDIVFSHMTVVFALSGSSYFAVLQSSLHHLWSARFGSTLKGDLRYTPTDCFETFPLPNMSHGELITIGEQYHEYRRQLMLNRQEGLTQTYNRFHDPTEQDEDIVELRRLHMEMDNAVLAAYGWTNITLDHVFRHPDHEEVGAEALRNLKKKERNDVRFTLSDGVKEELLRRLLKLNFEIAAGEARGSGQESVVSNQGAVDSGKRSAVSGQPSAGGGRQLGLFEEARQMGLFEEE